jgi:hypothetical protein
MDREQLERRRAELEAELKRVELHANQLIGAIALAKELLAQMGAGAAKALEE